MPHAFWIGSLLLRITHEYHRETGGTGWRRPASWRRMRCRRTCRPRRKPCQHQRRHRPATAASGGDARTPPRVFLGARILELGRQCLSLAPRQLAPPSFRLHLRAPGLVSLRPIVAIPRRLLAAFAPRGETPASWLSPPRPPTPFTSRIQSPRQWTLAITRVSPRASVNRHHGPFCIVMAPCRAKY